MKRKIINTTLIDLFGEKDFINHLYKGRELWLRTEIGTPEWNVSHEELTKIVITYIRTGVIFYTVVGHPETEFYAASGSMKVMCMKVAELDPVNEVNTDVFDLNRVRFDDKITKIINFDNSDKDVEYINILY